MRKKSGELPLRVLYIMGTGRSGSTVLDIVLGNHPQIESVGELTNLPRSGWVNGEYCACGQRGNVCPFWTEVRRVWVQRTGVDDVTGYIALQAAFERYRRWPQLLKERRRPSSLFQAYTKQTCALFEAIRDVSGKSIIVDSSKSPTRAFALSLVSSVDLYLIHLVRDGRGVAWSLKKAYKKDEKAGLQKDINPRPVWRTAAFWTIANLQSTWTRHQIPPERSIHICYEDFVAKPGKVLNRVGDLIGLDFSEVARPVEAGTALPVGHTIAGNRLRMAGDVRLRLDTEWTRKMPTRDRWLVWSLAGWLMRLYGYKR